MTPPAFLANHLSRSPAVATIPAGADFLRCLIVPLVEAYRDDQFSLSRLTIYLPNNRAKRQAAILFGELAGDREATLLPHLRALGDLDEEDLILSGQPPAGALDLLPSADPTTRRLKLAALTRQKALALDRVADWPTSIRAGDVLGNFLDGLHRDDIPFEALETISPEDLGDDIAVHWKESLAFLSILGTAWPEILKEKGWMESAARRTAFMNIMGDALLADESRNPVIIAGSLGMVRATSQFMAKVASSPAGVVVLPGLDLSLDDTAWRAIEAPHPQAIFRDWLSTDLNDLPRDKIQDWVQQDDGLNARRRFLSLALRPADATDSWFEGYAALSESGELKAAQTGLSLLSAANSDEEAALISLLLREALEEPGRTAMLVTPDRDLARRISAKLRAWNIEADDTGGIPLGGTFRGTFLRTIAAWLDDPSSGAALMQMLNHELSSWGQSIDISRRIARRIDRQLRGPKYPCWADLVGALHSKFEHDDTEGAILLKMLSDHLEAYTDGTDFSAQMRTVLALAEELTATDDEDGHSRLWRYEDGEQLATTLDGLMASGELPDEPVQGQMAAMLDALMVGVLVRKIGTGHPRLFVYGLVEARLQTADLTILAGLNEGVWPDAAKEDPFLSRQMRSALGLSLPEQTIGRAAHDFEQHAARPKVVLSRSKRQGRSPASASRWWVRISSFLTAAGLYHDADVTPRLRSLRRIREIPPAEQIDYARPPCPNPPIETLPRRLSVTEVGRLMRDPYAIYAKHVLGLRRIDPLDTAVGHAERGSVFHDLLECFGSEPTVQPDILLQTRLSKIFSAYRIPEEYQIYWRRDLDRMLSFWESFQETLRDHTKAAWCEESGEWNLTLKSGEMVLRGRADRIDEWMNGLLSIVDYKTGVTPTMKQDLKFDPQLSLLALMARDGAFEKIGSKQTEYISYLKVTADKVSVPIFGALGPKSKDGSSEKSGEELQDHLKHVEHDFRELMEAMLSGNRPFPSQIYPKTVGEAGDYDHLARRGEWAVRGGDDAEGSNGD